MRVRVNPFLRVVPDRGCEEYRITDLRTNAEYEVPNPGMLALLGHARQWSDRGDLERVATEEYGLNAERAASVVGSMLEHGFLVDPDDDAVALAETGREWAAEGWAEAFEFLTCIRDYPYYRSHDYESAMERVASRAERGDVPPVYKSYEGCPREPLPAVEDADPMPAIGDVLAGGGCESEATLDRETLGSILHHTFGETGRQELPGVGEFLLKTSPSGGGRHPTEAYVAVVDVPDLPTGLYHYAVEHHALERLADADGAAELVACLDAGVESVAGGDPAAVVACTAVVERNMWKYRDPRAYRIPFHDFGHLVETLRLCCAARTIPVRFGAALDRDRLCASLSVSPLVEPPVGYALVGEASEESSG